MKKILIAEDDESIRLLMKYDFNNVGYEVIEFDNGKDAYEFLLQETVDICIVDYMMPKMDGKELVTKLREEGIDTHIIMLTAKDDELSKISMFEIGVDNYITKPFSQRELLARVKRIFSKNSNNKINHNNLRLDYDKYKVFENDKELKLSIKDFELLKLLLLNKGKVLSRDIILNKIWGYEQGDTTRVVDVHIYQLRDALSEDIIKTIRGVGYTIE